MFLYFACFSIIFCIVSLSGVVLYVACFGVSFCTVSPHACLDVV